MGFEALLLRLIAREFVDEIAELRGAFGGVTRFVLACETASDFVKERSDYREVCVAQLVIQLVGGVQLDFAFQALLLRGAGLGPGLLTGCLTDNRDLNLGLVVLDTEDLINQSFVGQLGE